MPRSSVTIGRAGQWLDRSTELMSSLDASSEGPPVRTASSEDTRDRHERPHATRPLTVRPFVWLRDLYVCLDRTRTFGLAAQTAFWLFLSLIPLAAVAGLAAARISSEHWDRVNPLLRSLPVATRGLIQSELVKVSSWNGGTVSITAAIVFVWLGSSGIHALFDALELETGASRPWWKKRALSIATCFGLSITVAILAVLGPGLEGGIDWLARLIPGFEGFDFRNTWWQLRSEERRVGKECRSRW